ncbi:nucleoside-diphosphate kinase [Candidatus Bathyarchaeota archaeon]|nr:MAG: nucleoside-diphosphate kinase [Candidatus Bathyarchaeota archaeon]
MAEKTFIILKPETIKNRLVGEVLSRIEKAGFKILAIKIVKATMEQAEKLYEVHKGKNFYEELINHITSGPIIPMIVEAEDAIKRMRMLIGATNPKEAKPGTIRGDFGISITMNIIHAADSYESFLRESTIFFDEKEILKY